MLQASDSPDIPRKKGWHNFFDGGILFDIAGENPLHHPDQ